MYEGNWVRPSSAACDGENVGRTRSFSVPSTLMRGTKPPCTPNSLLGFTCKSTVSPPAATGSRCRSSRTTGELYHEPRVVRFVYGSTQAYVQPCRSRTSKSSRCAGDAAVPYRTTGSLKWRSRELFASTLRYIVMLGGESLHMAEQPHSLLPSSLHTSSAGAVYVPLPRSEAWNIPARSASLTSFRLHPALNVVGMTCPAK